MFDVFGSLKSIVKTGATITDNEVFKLHYKATSLIMLAFSILVTSKQYIGDPIDCVTSETSKQIEKMLDTYCWIHSTYTLPSAWNKTTGVHVPYPGVDKIVQDEKHTVVYHRYYQWVGFALFFQAITFYAPRWIWKTMERNRMRSLVFDLNTPVQQKDEREKKILMLASYFVDSLKTHRMYAFVYFLCEVMNFVNVVLQIVLIDKFLGGEFSTYGIDVIRFTDTDQSNRVDPMIRVFPRMTKCMFYTYGSSGDVQQQDALCILPNNIVNEKIYVFLWFWMVIVAIISGLMLLWRIPLFKFKSLRLRVMQVFNRFDKFKMAEFIRVGDIGDWFVLHLLGKNIDSLVFKDLVDKIYDKIPLALDKS